MVKREKVLLKVFIIYLICYLFRILEYFVLRTDRTFWGEAFVHKVIGILILFIAIKALSLSGGNIGFSKKHILKKVVWGLLFGVLMFIIAYGVEIVTEASQGNFKSLEVYVSTYAVDENIGKETALIFFLICIAGNIINVIMEEGIFRGLFQKVLEERYTFITVAIITSFLFGLWHIVSPIRSYIDGGSSLGGTIGNCTMLVMTSTLVGFKFSMLTKLTKSLYMAMGDHFVNNTIVNILHVVSLSGADELMFVRITVAQSLSFIIVLIFYLHRNRMIKRSLVNSR